MSNVMEYKGYKALIQFSADDNEFFGTVGDIDRHIINFGGKSVAELKKHMKESVDGYLKFCEERGIEPKKPFNGRITYRTTPQIHAKLAQAAMLAGKRSLNAFIDEIMIAQTTKILDQHKS
ncbi:MAG: type II toxin-antitoxin system HicB family antitoxin [Rickettsiales bacterium]|jgi:predicted HicB family RNase H-like nuclease